MLGSGPRFQFISVVLRFGVVGLTGLEPVTLRLSSACSNQLSYRPGSPCEMTNDQVPSAVSVHLREGALARVACPARTGGAEEIRTPDL